MSPVRTAHRNPTSAIQARALATRKAIEPKMSGAQTSRLISAVSRPWTRAPNVLMLKKIVPASWTAAAHHSMSRGFAPM